TAGSIHDASTSRLTSVSPWARTKLLPGTRDTDRPRCFWPPPASSAARAMVTVESRVIPRGGAAVAAFRARRATRGDRGWGVGGAGDDGRSDRPPPAGEDDLLEHLDGPAGQERLEVP